MARDIDTSGAERPSKKLNGKRHDLDAPERIASGSASARTQAAPDVRGSAQSLIKYKQQSQPARHQIEILTARNADLQQELIELAEKEAQARHLAYHDGLTGLPNRSLLQDRFVQATAQAERHRKPLALLLLDLDGFKWVNDKLGHGSGDRLLQAVADRLNVGIRGADTACRYGGDEFVLMLPEVDSVGVAAVVAKVRTRLSEPYTIDRCVIRVTASVGAAVFPTDGRTYEELMARADSAMYRDKPTGRRTSILMPRRNENTQAQAARSHADPLGDHSFFVSDDSATASG